MTPSDQASARHQLIPEHVRAVLFDAGGVLLAPDQHFFEAELERAGIAGKDVDAHAVVAAMTHTGSAESDPRQYWLGDGKFHALAKVLGVDSEQARQFWTAVGTGRAATKLWSALSPGATDCLAGLSEVGYAIGIISNSNGTVRRIVDDLGIAQYFDAIVDSYTFGCEKPDPSIFREGARLLGVELRHCVFVGDDPYFDIKGSSNAGVAAAILFDPYRLSGQARCPTIRQLHELVTDSAEPEVGS
jgi:HAD superfamily hydrolase (TIGR01509 family)